MSSIGSGVRVSSSPPTLPLQAEYLRANNALLKRLKELGYDTSKFLMGVHTPQQIGKPR